VQALYNRNILSLKLQFVFGSNTAISQLCFMRTCINPLQPFWAGLTTVIFPFLFRMMLLQLIFHFDVYKIKKKNMGKSHIKLK